MVHEGNRIFLVQSKVIIVSQYFIRIQTNLLFLVHLR
jgi:hypothetical protein